MATKWLLFGGVCLFAALPGRCSRGRASSLPLGAGGPGKAFLLAGPCSFLFFVYRVAALRCRVSFCYLLGLQIAIPIWIG